MKAETQNAENEYREVESLIEQAVTMISHVTSKEQITKIIDYIIYVVTFY